MIKIDIMEIDDDEHKSTSDTNQCYVAPLTLMGYNEDNEDYSINEMYTSTINNTLNKNTINNILNPILTAFIVKLTKKQYYSYIQSRLKSYTLQHHMSLKSIKC